MSLRDRAQSSEVLGLNFWKGTSAKFEGHFTMNSYHATLVEIKKELNEATIEFPKYHLKIRTEDRIGLNLKIIIMNITKCYFSV